ncbi:SMC-Scp complex subunit ScpB [Thermogutta sp.]|uniref:SMC-Scp complex subunit ScpB n=1 Tax=Thermogutta sp. TaxID=1962930 RepID=UPI003220874A
MQYFWRKRSRYETSPPLCRRPDWRLFLRRIPSATSQTEALGPREGPVWGEGVRRVEAALFLARQPLTPRKIAQICGFESAAEVRGYLRRLGKLYDEVGAAFCLVEVAGGFQLRTRPEFYPWVARLGRDQRQIRLSPPAMETLAIIAYRQPVLRAEIESIRGVQCGEILRQLMDRGLVKIVGRSEELGRPYLYGTTDTFLEVFGLRGLDELPHAEYRNSAVRREAQLELQDSAPLTGEGRI